MTKLMSVFIHRSVSATYQWGGVACLDIVSAPLGTALVFYGPPALHVHAMPLLGQDDLLQSAAVLAAQHALAQHGSAQHDSEQLGSAQNESAQNESAKCSSAQHARAQGNATQSSQNYSQHDDTSPHAALDTSTQAAAARSEPSSRQNNAVARHDLASAKVGDHVVADHESASKSDLQSPARLQTMQDATQTQPAAAETEDEETDGANEGLFGEASVLARGGLRMTEKVKCA